ncbi:hypothetical protein BDZ45DRAFT_233523 [Acephala macrosclerotiorum]|nr:hypothetical protein BDZ45DRAFT_233523 [Acephala macrosclerotiorum]
MAARLILTTSILDNLSVLGCKLDELQKCSPLRWTRDIPNSFCKPPSFAMSPSEFHYVCDWFLVGDHDGPLPRLSRIFIGEVRAAGERQTQVRECRIVNDKSCLNW